MQITGTKKSSCKGAEGGTFLVQSERILRPVVPEQNVEREAL